MVSKIYNKQVELCGKMLEVANSTTNCALKDDLYEEIRSTLLKVFVYFKRVNTTVSAEDKGVAAEIIEDLQYNFDKMNCKKLQVIIGEARYLVETY